MKPLILFDLDGTLIDSLDTFVKIGNSLAKKKGFNSSATHDHVRSLPSEKLRKAFGVPFWKVFSFIHEYINLFEKEIPKLKLHKNVKKILIEAKKYAHLGIISSNSSNNIRELLSEHKIEKHFKFVEHGSIFGKNKKIRELAKSLKIPNNHVLYIGDETRDIHAARRAGSISLAVTWGYQSEDVLIKAKPNLLARNVNEANELIYAWLKSLL